MGLLSRILALFRSKANRTITSLEDEGELLDLAYEELRDEEQNIRNALVDLATEKNRLQLRQKKLEESIEERNTQARQAVKQGDEELAREALARKADAMSELESLLDDIRDLGETQQQLTQQKERLQRRVQNFRREKETTKARLSGAEANASAKEALSGTSGDGPERQMERANDKLEELTARSNALDELTAEGVLGEEDDDIDSRLDELSTGAAIEDELSVIRSDLGVDDPSIDEDPEAEAESETEDESN